MHRTRAGVDLYQCTQGSQVRSLLAGRQDSTRVRRAEELKCDDPRIIVKLLRTRLLGMSCSRDPSPRPPRPGNIADHVRSSNCCSCWSLYSCQAPLRTDGGAGDTLRRLHGWPGLHPTGCSGRRRPWDAGQSAVHQAGILRRRRREGLVVSTTGPAVSPLEDTDGARPSRTEPVT